jgi:plasmid stabilization system protein ParE
MELRSSAFENYVVFFRDHQGQLQVVNIVEGHRDIPEMFSSTQPE